MKPAVEAHHLSKRFRRGRLGVASLRDELELLFRKAPAAHGDLFYALEDVSFAVEWGRICAVLGRNGSGKTTLMKILASITEPTAGEVILRGRVGSLLEVGAGFDDELDGVENIFLNGAILGMSHAEIRRKLDDIIRFADVGPVLETPVKRYSSGMYVRLAFAVAAHLDADILLVDEVLAVGDAEFQRKCLSTMKDLAAQGRTMFFVSHNMGAVRQICDMGLVLDAGRLADAGELDPVLERYLRSGAEAAGAIVFRDGVTAEAAFFDPDGAQKPVLTFGRDYDLVLTIRSQAPLLGVFASLDVFNDDGLRVGSLDSAREGLASFDIDGAGELRFRIASLGLAPGAYRLGFSLWRPELDQPIVRTDALRTFDVAPAAVPGAAAAYSRDQGLVRIASSGAFRPLG